MKRPDELPEAWQDCYDTPARISWLSLAVWIALAVGAVWIALLIGRAVTGVV